MKTNGVTFGNKHSINDWDLLLVSKNIGEAKVKTNYIDIPGTNGSIDLTEAFGDIRYNDRTLNFTFEIFNHPSTWWELKKEIAQYLHGRKMKIILDQDDEYYYLGRCEINQFSNTTAIASITIDCTCAPYKYKKEKTVQSFIIQGNTTLNLENARLTVIPKITLSNYMNLYFNGSYYALSAGTHTNYNIQLVEGINEIMVTEGTGSITFEYQEGDL